MALAVDGKIVGSVSSSLYGTYLVGSYSSQAFPLAHAIAKSEIVHVPMQRNKLEQSFMCRH